MAETAPLVPEAPVPFVIIEDLPLCEGIPPEKNGILKVHSIEPLGSLRDRLEGVFSIVQYYSAKGKTAAERDASYSKSVYYKGVLHMLRLVHHEAGPFRNWGLVLYTDYTTLRILQRVFPFSIYPKLCIVMVNWPFYAMSNGSIDTSVLRCLRFQVVDLFPRQICLIRDADTLFQRVLILTTASDENVTNAIEVWEAHFLSRWRGMVASPPLVIGTSILYKKEWHVNTPLSLAFPFNVESTRQTRIPRETFLEQNKVVFGAEFDSTIFGVLAGFVNVASDKSTLGGLWQRCVEYLQTRFFMARFPYQYGYKRYISNTFSSKYYGATVGKDEKCILFVMCRYYLPSIYFFDIHYSAENSLGRTEERFTYLVEGTKNIKYAWKPKNRGYTNENTVIRELALYGVPTIEVTPGVVSHLLNPASIDTVLDIAKASAWTRNFMSSSELHKTGIVMPLHELYHLKMRSAIDLYENWLAETPHSELYETLKKQLKNYVSSQEAVGKKYDFNTTGDDLFLQNAGIYSLSEETEFAEKYKANKALKNAENAAEKAAEKAAVEAPGGIPGAEVASAGGVRRKTRKHHRFTKKRKSTIRRRT
jgi:hypothetical protein